MTEQEIDKLVTERVITVMNELLDCDRIAIQGVIDARVACNEALADHPTAQVGTRDGHFTIGLLGILNGICNRSTPGAKGPICTIYNCDSSGAPESIYPEAFATLEDAKHWGKDAKH